MGNNLAERSAQLDAVVRLLPVWQLGVLRFNEAIARELGIAGSDLQCLFLLDRSGPNTPGAIARSIGLTTGSTSRMVERLLAAGLVSREPDPADRRRVTVTIQPAASTRLHALYDPLDDDLLGLLDRFDDSSLGQLHLFVEAAIRVTADRAPD